MALNKATQVNGYGIYPYLAIDKDSPVQIAPIKIFTPAIEAVEAQDEIPATDTSPEIPGVIGVDAVPAVVGIVYVRLNVCLNRNFNQAKNYADTLPMEALSLDAYQTLMIANDNNMMGCLYALLREKASYTDSDGVSDILEEGQTKIVLK